MKRSVIFLLIIFFHFAFTANSQSNLWPSVFMVPGQADNESQNDSSYLSISNRITILEMLKNESRVRWQKSDSRYKMEQNADYVLSNYNVNTRNQYLDLSGSLLFNHFESNNLWLGLDWMPVAVYNKRQSGGVFQSKLDAGPVLRAEVFRIPLAVRAGVSANIWNENVSKAVFRSGFSGFNSDPGLYAGCEIGDPSQKLNFFPVYLNIKAIGRSINNNGLGIIMGSVLAAEQLQSGDSIFIYAGDSLSNGKELYLGESEGNTIYKPTPWNINHSMSAATGLKMKERLGFVPAAFYRFNLKSTSYPSDRFSLNDVKTVANSLNFQLSTSEIYFFDYSGGIEISWEDEDWLFTKKLGTALNTQVVADSQTIIENMQIKANVNDKNSIVSKTDHYFLIKFPRNFFLDYALGVNRDARMYNNHYLSGGEKTWNHNESDNVRILHHAGLFYEEEKKVHLELYGDYKKTYSYYYRKERSGESRIRQGYKIGSRILYSNNRFSIDEELYAECDITDYKFPYAHKDTLDFYFDPPPYSRRVSSVMRTKWSIREDFHLTGMWIETYSDFGKWYGREYFEEEISKEYYAIESKTIDYLIQAGIEIDFDKISFSSACSFRDIYYRSYDFKSDSYTIEDLGDGYIFEPSMKLTHYSDKLRLQMSVGRRINTKDDSKWDFKKNWDIAFIAEGRFW